MKKTILVTLFLLPFFSFSQISTPEIFIDAGLYYEDQLDDEISAYGKFSAGIQLFSLNFIAPEVDVSYYAGNGGTVISNFDYTIGAVSDGYQLSRNFNSTIWGFAPKLFLDADEVRWVLIPKYSFGNVFAEGRYLDTDDIEINQNAKDKIYFWSFGFGLESFANEGNTRYAIYLWYSGFNAGTALNRLDFESVGFRKKNYNTRTLGVSFRLNISFKRKNLTKSLAHY